MSHELVKRLSGQYSGHEDEVPGVGEVGGGVSDCPQQG